MLGGVGGAVPRGVVLPGAGGRVLDVVLLAGPAVLEVGPAPAEGSVFVVVPETGAATVAPEPRSWAKAVTPPAMSSAGTATASTR